MRYTFLSHKYIGIMSKIWMCIFKLICYKWGLELHLAHYHSYSVKADPRIFVLYYYHFFLIFFLLLEIVFCDSYINSLISVTEMLSVG